MKIYTKTGDSGTTGLLRGGRVPKHHPRVEAYGTFDELNSWIGYARSLATDSGVSDLLLELQPRIHTLCSDVAADPTDEADHPLLPRISSDDVQFLENAIDRMDGELPALTNFILPGGATVGAVLHIARTICRRGERRLTELVEIGGSINEHSLVFANRLSDFLFTLARWTNHRAGQVETSWVGVKKS